MRFPVAVRKSAKRSQKAIPKRSRLAWAASNPLGLILAVFVLSLFWSPTARAQQSSGAGPGDTLRVCADPGNLPFSNRMGEGFENRIATRDKDVKLRLLDTEKVKAEKTKWQLINVVLPVVIVIIFGIAYAFIRLRRYAS